MTVATETNCVLHLTLQRRGRLRIVDSWLQRLKLYRWTLCSNFGGVSKEIGHGSVSTRSNIPQKFRNAKCFAAEYRRVVTKLRLLQMKSCGVISGETEGLVVR